MFTDVEYEGPRFGLLETALGLRELAAAKPDKVYKPLKKNDRGCAYIHGKKTPGCIVGHWGLRSGVPLDYLLDPRINTGCGAISLHCWRDDDNRVGRFASAVQENQDLGFSWRNAFNVALRDYQSRDDFTELKGIDLV